MRFNIITVAVRLTLRVNFHGINWKGHISPISTPMTPSALFIKYRQLGFSAAYLVALHEYQDRQNGINSLGINSGQFARQNTLSAIEGLKEKNRIICSAMGLPRELLGEPNE